MSVRKMVNDNTVRVNESWPNSHGVRGPGGAGVPSELGYSRLRFLSLENNRLSGSVPPSLVPCVALVDLHRTLQHNLLSGSTPLELAGHTGASQSFHSELVDSVMQEGADIPEYMRLRKFRVDLPAVDATSEPSFATFESRDACLWSPNVLLRCAPPNGAAGQGEVALCHVPCARVRWGACTLADAYQRRIDAPPMGARRALKDDAVIVAVDDEGMRQLITRRRRKPDRVRAARLGHVDRQLYACRVGHRRHVAYRPRAFDGDPPVR